MKKNERRLYQPVKDALGECIEKALHSNAMFDPLPPIWKTWGKYYLEITDRGRYSQELAKLFDDITLFLLKKSNHPDITGYIAPYPCYRGTPTPDYGSYFPIVVEIKDRLEPNDFFQIKRYGEIFKARYALLVSSEEIPEEIRRLIKRRPEIRRFLHHKVKNSFATSQIEICHFNETTKKFSFDPEFYIYDSPGNPPEPFQFIRNPARYLVNT